MLESYLKIKSDGVANINSVIKGDGYRITVLTNCVIRVEKNKDNKFTDEPSQIVFYRNFNTPNFETNNTKKELVIKTESATFYFNKLLKKVTHVIPYGFTEKVGANNIANLKGTRRTLDGVFCKVPLDNGVLSKNGVAIIDDSKSLILNKNGEIALREHSEKDIYIFANGREYLKGLNDFYKLTGKPPIIPRFALGNWWSRYRAYTDTEYKNVIEKFERKKVPLSVATIDMDWHWVDVEQRFGIEYKRNLLKGKICGGWTGYSWNTELFPDYVDFLNWLKNKNLKITLNLHPSDGIRWFEDIYEDMCKELGLDYKTKEDIPFDITDPKFINAYFKILHHPYEKNGVDFWWIDWQQGKNTKIKGLDPLYSLNHFHYLDNANSHDEPLILSRYAGLGSHRYPLGFSGDTFANWSVLKFIPYFTANASNAGYTWWSHDIGGHHYGIKSDELYLRWIQFGVFNPILRLHSTSHDLLGKEPWNCASGLVEKQAIDFLRFRRQLIPYIYSMNILTHEKGVPLCMPMYYKYPNIENAYKCPNQYWFGSEFIVAPIISKINKKLKMAKVNIFLPKGKWTDIMTGMTYTGNDNIVNMYRDLSKLPVLAKEGAIIPLDKEKFANGVELPKALKVLVYKGTNSFNLIEKANKKMLSTKFTINDKNKKIVFVKSKASINVLNYSRDYEFVFMDIVFKKAQVFINNQKINSEIYNNIIILNNILLSDEIKIEIENYTPKENPNTYENVVSVMSKWQGSVLRKMLAYKKLNKIKHNLKKFIYVSKNSLLIPKIVRNAIKELE